MKISEQYREEHGLTPAKIADTMIAWYEKIDALHAQIAQKLQDAGTPMQCRAGCCGCCHDDLTMTQAEAAVVRKLFPEIGRENPHKPGACAFLNEAGLCRIYPARPYICRTHGLPIRRTLSPEEIEQFRDELGLGEDVSDDAELETRDICDENALVMDVMELPEEMLFDDDTAITQLILMESCTFPDDIRIPMRDFFQN